MYYLINNASDMTFAEQIATTDTFCWLSQAKQQADRRKAQTGDNWEVIKIESVYTTQTLDEAMGDDK